jgi:hypothetical protein
VYKNYVLLFDGWRPTSRELEQLGAALPGLRNVAPPALPAYLPEQGLVRNSERYILGLVSLSRFVPAFKPELAGFEVSGEAQYARYRIGEAEVPVIVFAYPTPQVATQQARQFEQQGNLVVRRTSSLVALAMDAPDRAAAAQLIAGLHYEANFMWNQATQPRRPPNVAGMLVAIFELTGLLLVICVLGGVGFAFLWYYLRKRDAALRGDEATMIRLNI